MLVGKYQPSERGIGSKTPQPWQADPSLRAFELHGHVLSALENARTDAGGDFFCHLLKVM